MLFSLPGKAQQIDWGKTLGSGHPTLPPTSMFWVRGRMTEPSFLSLLPLGLCMRHAQCHSLALS